MARPKKNREISIVHFSFFDLLFGAFGAFVFLMIMQVLSTLNLVDADIQTLVDRTVQKNTELTKELERFKGAHEKLTSLQHQYAQANDERKSLIRQNELLEKQRRSLEAKMVSLQEQLEAGQKEQLSAQKDAGRQRALMEKNKALQQELDHARQKLATMKTMPLEIKSRSFPTMFADEKLHLALAAEGGVPPYTWEMDGELPRDLHFDMTKGIITGTAYKPGRYDFKVKVTDAQGQSAVSKTAIALNVVQKVKKAQRKVSMWFLIMAAVSTLLLAYILWGKYKAHKAYKEMIAKGFKPVWVKN